ncbi:uncharacterized protein MELLADRAFT_90333 [Melampsora larici-populina 98AG31]|uniref:Glycosyltransferase family 49 protein n=1 Tax=Melampsora larici-populina (strain 98AG31 / pathotype 3-4-7) TaxID=747676 RepID=F4RWK0_MELLP|nr:uncharacterized protein MELLADRAFT_90333 [Melampsora larici-populina 98AG31]EGG03295.1 hypothetical protein MELLADRAFT_90333 [Melampsora larici-populina 98AG31]
MPLRPGPRKRSNSINPSPSSKQQKDSTSTTEGSGSKALPSSTEWASQRFGFDHSSSNPSTPPYLGTPETTPRISRIASNEKNRSTLSSSTIDSPSHTFFEYELGQGCARAGSPSGRHFLSPSQSDQSFSIMNCSAKSSSSPDRREDTRIEFERSGNPPCSPAAGISSSVAVTATVTITSTAVPPAGFSRTGQPTTHRRLTSLDNANRPQEFTLRKTAPPPINVPALTWSEKPIDFLTASSSGSSSSDPPRSFIYTFLRGWPSSSSGYENSASHSDKKDSLSFRYLIRTFLFLPLGFLQFLLAPFGSLIFIPEFLHSSTISKSSGFSPHSKPRGRKLPNLLALLYVFFSITIFSQEMCVRFGLVTSKSQGKFKALKARLVIRKVEELAWVRDWASARFGTNENATSLVNPSPVSVEDVKSQDTAWDPNVALKRRPVEINHSSSGGRLSGQLNLNADPFSIFPHAARFAKMHSKLGSEFTSDISPFFFKSTNPVETSAITACLYTNSFWLAQLPDFLTEWPGPISLVVESTSSDRHELISAIERLRVDNPAIRALVDFHLVFNAVSDLRRDHTLQRMLTAPLATNAHLNLARFFSRTDLVWLVGDARVTPGAGLYQSLVDDATIRRRVLDYGDAIVVPTFGIERNRKASPIPKENIDTETAVEYLKSEFTSLKLPRSEWPTSKEGLVSLADTDEPHETPISLFDRSWQPTKGPTNWPLWKILKGDELLQRSAEEGGGIGLGVAPGKVGGGDELYRVSNYELNYAPNLIMSREGQAWCTERFEVNKAACVYQMYLSGAELWVTPRGWAFTLERMHVKARELNDAQRLMDSISSRLYTKFHQEACMQYGREFISLGIWDDERASHLRAMCSKVLTSWGVGAITPGKH